MTNRAQTATLIRTMVDFRKSVRTALKRRGWSVYRLVYALKGKRRDGKDVPPAPIYSFVRGSSTLNSDDLGLIFDALQIKLTLPPRDA